jgi:hypothetical protein
LAARGAVPRHLDPLTIETTLSSIAGARLTFARRSKETIMAIASDYKYMRDSGPPPRFEEAFAFKHILNLVDSDAAFLKEKRALDKHSERVDKAQTNTNRAYAQAMNRFNTPATTAQFETILEPVEAQTKPEYNTERSGQRSYYLRVERGWKFERIDNNFAAPNYTKYEAVLRAQFTSPRQANMSCMGQPGVVNHWDQTQNQTWFG